MLDIGWTELLVIAIVLIVVVGPKDLPPMLRAFGKMTSRLRSMAGEFRQQFDEALKEADLDDVRKTISDAQKLNPVNSLKDAMNPLRKLGEDIRTDLQKSVKTEPSAAAVDTGTKAEEPFRIPEPAMTLPDTAPVVPDMAPSSVAEPQPQTKPARKPRAAKTVKAEGVAVADKTSAPTPKRAPRKLADGKPAARAEAPAVEVPAVEMKAEPKKPAVRKPAAPKKTVARAKKTGDA